MKTLVLGCLAILLTTLPTPAAHAAFMFTVVQDPADPADVLVTGQGTIDLTDLTYSGSGVGYAAINPSDAELFTGTSPLNRDTYTGFSGPASFGLGGDTYSTSGSGDHLGIDGVAGYLSVPAGYVSGTQLSTTSIFANTTLSALGADPGTYTYTWGSGDHVDSLTINVAPEPSTWALLGLGAGLLGLTLRRRTTRV